MLLAALNRALYYEKERSREVFMVIGCTAYIDKFPGAFEMFHNAVRDLSSALEKPSLRKSMFLHLETPLGIVIRKLLEEHNL